MVETEQHASAIILVYLCTGEVKVFPEARRVDVRDDDLVCLDDEGCEMARFRTRDVYMCSSKPVPRALL